MEDVTKPSSKGSFQSKASEHPSSKSDGNQQTDDWLQQLTEDLQSPYTGQHSTKGTHSLAQARNSRNGDM